MSNSSAEQTYSITSSDTITLTGVDAIYTGSGISGPGNTITIGNGGSGFTVGGAGIGNTNYTSGAGATVGGITNIRTIGTISSINTSAFTFDSSEEWVNCFPDFDRIEKMCKEYPGLAIAVEKFKTTYKLVKDHYDTPEDKRPKP